MSDFETNLPLGKPTSYRDEYDAALLCPFPRQPKRAELGLPGELPFAGFDLWNAYELSWLDQRGKPVVAVAEFRFPCTSTFLIESKSFKLYLNSLNQTRFTDLAAVAATLERDLTRASGAPVGVRLLAPAALAGAPLADFPGRCLDGEPEQSRQRLSAWSAQGARDRGPRRTRRRGTAGSGPWPRRSAPASPDRVSPRGCGRGRAPRDVPPVAADRRVRTR